MSEAKKEAAEKAAAEKAAAEKAASEKAASKKAAAEKEPKAKKTFSPSDEAIAKKVKAGLSKAQAIEVLKAQWEHDQTNPHD